MSDTKLSERVVWLNDLLKFIITMLLLSAVVSLVLVFYLAGSGSEEGEVAEGAETEAVAEASAEATGSDEDAEEDAEMEAVTPTVNALAANEATVGDTVDLSGTGGAGNEIGILANGDSIGTTTVGDDGEWTYGAAFDEPGEYEIQAGTLDSDGGVMELSEPFQLTVSEAMMAPTLNVDSGDMAAGDEISVSGEGIPGSDVEILADGEVIGTTTVGEDGTWQYTHNFAEPGDYELQARVAGSDDSSLMSSLAPLAILPAFALPTLDLPDFSGIFAGDEVELNGTGEPGSEVAIVSNGEVVGNATVGEDGTWSFPWPSGEAGDYDLQVQTLDADGNVVNESEASSFSLNLPEIALPNFEMPDLDLGNLFAGDEVDLSGTGEPGSEVAIVSNGEVIGNATVGEDGTWSFPWPSGEAGDYDLQVQTLDADGNVVNESDPFSLSFGLPDVSLPSFEMPDLDLGNLFAGDEVDLSGTGEPGSEVAIVADGEVVGNATVGEDGTWSFPWPSGEAGDYELQVQTLDADGNVVNESDPFTLSFALPEIALPSFELPDLDLDNLLAGDEVELGGVGEPGSEVAIVADGEVVGTATVGEDGTWSFPWPSGEAGDYELQVQTLDEDGNVVNESDPFTLSFSLPDFTVPILELPDFDLGGFFAGSESTLTGAGEPGNQVEVVVDGEVVGTAIVGEDGTWSFDYPFADPGDYDIVLRVLDEDGNALGESDSISLTVAEPVPPTLEGLSISEALTDESITVSGTGAPGTEVEILADGTRFGVAPVREDGTWIYAIAFSDPGEYDVTAQTVDVDGNVIDETDASSVTVSTPAASEQFAFIFPADGGQIIQGFLTIVGTSEPGDEIEIFDDGESIGTTTTEDSGEWYFRFEPALGEHQFSAAVVGAGSELEARSLEVVPVGEVDCDSNLGISRGVNYIVGTCNTFGTVIERTGATLESLIEANPQIDNPDLIYPGDILNIP